MQYLLTQQEYDALHREKRLGRATTEFLAHCSAAAP